MASLENHNRLLEIFHRLLGEFGEQHWWPAKSNFEVCIGAILTQNTAWSNVEKAIHNLKRNNLLSAHAIYHTPIEYLASLIVPSGYYNIKATRVKNFVNFLVHSCKGRIENMLNGDLGQTRKRLLKVHGIGPETADSILLYAGNYPIFVVDAYTKRIFSRIGEIPEEISYQDLQDFFMSRLPEDSQLFNEYHALIVRLGKLICRKKPLCFNCPLKNLCICGGESS